MKAGGPDLLVIVGILGNDHCRAVLWDVLSSGLFGIRFAFLPSSAPFFYVWTTCLMSSRLNGYSDTSSKRNVRGTVDNRTENTAAGPSKLEIVHRALLAPFSHRKTDSSKILSDCTYLIALRPI